MAILNFENFKNCQNFCRRRNIKIVTGVNFIVVFKFDLRFCSNSSILPVGANSSIFGTFASTHLISPKLHQNIEDIILREKSRKKNWQLF